MKIVIFKKSSFLLITLFLFQHSLYGQETTLKSLKQGDLYEEYYVLNSNKKLKHGTYLQFKESVAGPHDIVIIGNYDNGLKTGKWEYFYDEPRNQIKEAGSYKNDLKDGIWITYYPAEDKDTKLIIDQQTGTISIKNTNTDIRSKEKYSEGKPVSVWEFYNPEKKLIQRFNFDDRKLLYDFTLLDTVIHKNHDAIFVGQKNNMYRLAHEAFDFEELMKQVDHLHLDTGIMQIQFTIATNGTMKDYIEKKNTLRNKKVNKQIYEAIHSLDNQWIPAHINGRPVESKKTMTLILTSRFNSSTTFHEIHNNNYFPWDQSIYWNRSTSRSVKINYTIYFTD